MRNTQSPKKRRRHHPADELNENQSSWIDMLLPVTCLTFCSNNGIKEQLQSATTMLAGLRICRKVNEEETVYKQGRSRTTGCDQETECTEAS